MYRRTALASAVIVAAWALIVARGTAQSPNAFGIPSADKPTPGADDQGGARIARAGLAGAGTFRSARAPRHGRDERSAGRRRRASRSCARAATRSTRPSRPAPCSTSRRRTTPASAAICSRSSGSAKDKKLYALNSGGWAPAGWTPEFFTEKLGVKSVPNSGVNSATVPGAISGYDALLKRFGTMTFKETFERAARIADEGWGLAERRHSDLRGAVNGLRADPDSTADVPRRRPGAGALQHHPQSRARRTRCA